MDTGLGPSLSLNNLVYLKQISDGSATLSCPSRSEPRKAGLGRGGPLTGSCDRGGKGATRLTSGRISAGKVVSSSTFPSWGAGVSRGQVGPEAGRAGREQHGVKGQGASEEGQPVSLARRAPHAPRASAAGSPSPQKLSRTSGPRVLCPPVPPETAWRVGCPEQTRSPDTPVLM